MAEVGLVQSHDGELPGDEAALIIFQYLSTLQVANGVGNYSGLGLLCSGWMYSWSRRTLSPHPHLNITLWCTTFMQSKNTFCFQLLYHNLSHKAILPLICQRHENLTAGPLFLIYVQHPVAPPRTVSGVLDTLRCWCPVPGPGTRIDSSSSHHFVGEQAEIATQPQIPFTIHNSNGMVTSRC